MPTPHPAMRRPLLTPLLRHSRDAVLAALVVLLALLVAALVLGGGVTAEDGIASEDGARIEPVARIGFAAPAQVAPTPPVGEPVEPCVDPNSLFPICGTTAQAPSDTPTSPTPAPAPAPSPDPPAPCDGEGCLPPLAPTGPADSDGPPGPGPSGPGESTDAPCGFTDIGGCITNAINGFFRGIVTAALNPLLDLLSNTLLTTPTPQDLPQLAGLWSSSWQILLACYGLLIILAGVLVMTHESVQTRYSAKEIAPRLVAGFLAGALSMWAATKAIEIANGVSRAVLGADLDAASAGDALREIVLGSLGDGGIFLILIGLVLAGMLVALLIGFVIRVALTVILIAGAPIALMFHALPQTEHIAYWWWKAFGGCLAIQVVQSLTLITAMRVFLTPGGFTLLGPNNDGLVNLLVACALMYILFKIPFWVLGSIRGGGGGRSFVGSLVRGFIAYKTFGLLSGRSRGGGSTAGRSGRARSWTASDGQAGGEPDPNARVRSTPDGQYVLPLGGLHRTRPDRTPTPGPATAAAGRRGGQGRQLALPLGEDWPENRPVLGRDGQYRLPLDVTRVPRPPAPSGPSAAPPSSPGRGRSRAGTQLELPLDPYRGNRPTRSGQYPLPLGDLRRSRAASAPPAAPIPVRRRPSGQLELPFDPYKANPPLRSGQYPLPFDDVAPVRRPTPPAAPVPPAAIPARRPAGQLRLPLDLPSRAGTPHPTTPPAPTPTARPAPRPPVAAPRKPPTPRRAAQSGRGGTPPTPPGASAPSAPPVPPARPTTARRRRPPSGGKS
ncbi:hypothetical protein ACU61A_37380 [Pseudonocardia sichuanensis]